MYTCPFLLEHPGNGIRRAEVAAEPAHLGANLGDGARWVVGHGIDEEGHAARTVSLVRDFLILDALELARAFLDGSLDVLLGHRRLFGGVDRQRSRGFPDGSPPPSFAAMVISRISFVNSAPRLASVAAL
jgi:hypothetical protein